MKQFSVNLVIALMLLALLVPAFAACSGVQLELYFMVDGEVYDTITTTGSEVIKLPPNPEKEGYVFRGWYWDYGIWQEPFTAESLINTPLSSSMSVYARFLPLDGEDTQTTSPGTAEPPTTDLPSTEEPTTQPPTTDLPTTEEPTTQPPTTDLPTTEEPTTQPPTTDLPTTEEPTTQPPTTEDPVPPEPSTITDIATIIASEDGGFKASGVVVGVNAQSFLLGDSTGMILVYLKADPGVKVGDQVTVDGTTSVYGGAKQFGIGTTVTLEQSGVTVKHPEPTIPSIEELNAYANESAITVKYVKLTGQLMPSGNYYNLNLGAAVIGSLTYPDAELKAQLDSMAGQNIEVWGYVTGVTGGNQYLNLMTTEVKLVIPDEPEVPTPVEADIATILASENGLYTTSGTVIAVNAQSFILADSTGSLLVYLKAQPNVQIGDTVSVTGSTTEYAIAKQFTTDTVVTVTGSTEISLNDPYEPTAEELNSLLNEAQIFVSYVKLTGTLTVSGNYYNFNMDGTALIGSLTYPMDELKAELDALNGQTFTVIGFTTGISGSGKYLNIMVEKIVPAQPDEPEQPEIIGEISIADAITMGNAMEHNTTTFDLYYVRGTISAIGNTTYGNMHITDGDGNLLYIYGLSSEDGSLTYGEMDPKPAIGDTILVLSVIGNYNGAQLKSAYLVEWTPAENNNPVDADIATIVDSDPGLFHTSGVVVGLNAKSMIVMDNTTGAMMLVYLDRQPEVAVGDMVDLVGTTTIYGGCKQFGTDTEISVTGHDEVSFGNAYRITAEELDYFTTADRVLVNYVTVEGLLDITANGYYNLYFDGVAIVGSLTYPDQALAAELAELNGQTVTLIGFITNTASNGKFLSIMVHEIVYDDPDVPVDPEPEEPEVLTPQEILDLAYGLANGEVTEQTYTLTGVISSIDTAWSDYYGNITVTIIVDNNTDQPIMCFRLQGDGAQNLQIGDTITVTGTLTNYNGTIEFSAGCNLDSVVPVEPELPDVPVDPEPEEPEVKTADIATIIASENGLYTTSGTVIAVNAQSFLLGDDTGMMLVYLKEAPGVQVGDRVTVEGTTSVYGGAKQFGIGTAVTVEESGITVTHPEPVTLSPAELDTYMTATEVKILFVELTGLLAHSGNFYNFFFDGAAITGSLTYPDQALAAKLDSLVDSTCTVTGYITGTASQGKFLNIMVVDIQVNEPELPDVPVDPEPEEPEVLTPQEILDLAYGLANGEVTEQTYTLTGVISSIDTAWSDYYGNITVTIIVDNNTDQPIMCFRLQGDGAQNLQIGDTITVTGTLTNYNGTIEFSAGCNLDSVVPVEPELPDVPVDPEPEEPEVKTADIATIIASENGLYTTSGTVIAVNAQSFLLGDDTGMMLVYLKESPGVQVGDRVTVEGTTSVYGGAKQFGIGTAVTVEESGITVKHPEPVTLSPTELDAYMTATEVKILFVELTGLLSHSGNFYNFFFDGAAITGSLTYPDQALAAKLDSLVDSTFTVTGYITGATSQGKFLNIMVVDIQVNEPEDDTPTADSDITVSQALAMGGTMAHNTTTVEKYYVTGTITDILNTTYGNMHISDDQGNTIYIYGLYDSTGSIRFNALETQPAVGDTITVYTVVGNYNGPQLKNAWLIETH